MICQAVRELGEGRRLISCDTGVCKCAPQSQPQCSNTASLTKPREKQAVWEQFLVVEEVSS